MTAEKIFKREDGTQISIIVSVYLESYRLNTGAIYSTMVRKRSKGKKKWISIHDRDAYKWRKLSMEDRLIVDRQKELEYVTIEEIQSVALELWGQMKPKFTS